MRKGAIAVVCVACRAAAKKHRNAPHKMKSLCLGTRRSTIVKCFALQRHATSTYHQKAVKSLTCADGSHPCAPSKDDFKKVIDHVLLHGSSVQSGIPEVGDAKKIGAMMIVGANACQYLDQLFFKTVKSITLMRDERKLKLLMRFCAVNAHFQQRRGIMGIEVGAGGKADQIVVSTSKIINEFATMYKGTKRAKRISSIRRIVRQKTHHCAVDSASNELAAVTMQRLPLVALLGPLTPNCKATVRDTTHSCRRFLSRPWAVDERLNTIVSRFARGRESPARMIQASPLMQAELRRCIKKLKPNMKTLMSNMRAAKHRFETFQKPLGRQIFLLLPIFMLMLIVANTWRTTAGPRAENWLIFIGETVCNLILCAMMADAADEASSPLRFFDTENYDTNLIHQKLTLYLNRVNDLFGMAERCLTEFGYTRLLLEMLRDKPLVWVVKGRTYTMEYPKDSQLRSCFGHMRAWLQLTMRTCKAEFPSFDYWMSFEVFNTKACTMDEAEYDAHCERLALASGSRKMNLAMQIRSIEPHVVQEMRRGPGNTGDAWAKVVDGLLSARASTRASKPCDAVAKALYMQRSFCGTTSGCEQTFTAAMAAVGDRQNPGPDLEWAYWKIKTDWGRDDPDKLLTLCQKIWARCFGIVRASGTLNRKTRFGAGVARQPLTDVDACEAAMIRARRGTRMSTLSFADVANVIDALPSRWTEKHAKEASFLETKLFNKKADAAADALLLPSEDQNGEMRRAGLARRAQLQKDIDSRMRSEVNHLMRACSGDAVSLDRLRGLVAYVEKAEYERLLSAAHLRHTVHVHEAEVLVVPLPGKVQPNLDSCWCAPLRGCWVVSPSMLEGRQSASLKYRAALRLNRILHISADFAAAHPDRYSTLRMCIGETKPCNFNVVDFADYKDYVEKRICARGSVVCALVTCAEKSAGFFKNHPKNVYTGPEFIHAMTSIDYENSFYGAAVHGG